jgi:hypothetical protein
MGVCRRNVRIQLSAGDVVIFFSGKLNQGFWNYYFIGFGTVQLALLDRKTIWNKDMFSLYRKFFNILIDSNGEHFEPFGEPHNDWKKRIEAPYIFFNPSNEYTNFNLVNPLHVAFCDPKENLIETWLENDLSIYLKECLFIKHFKTHRNLRINNVQRAHVHIAKHDFTFEELTQLRNDLKFILNSNTDISGFKSGINNRKVTDRGCN